MNKIILSALKSNRNIAEIVGQVLDQDKDKPIYFVGYHPTMELVAVIDTLIHQGYNQSNVITNQTGGQDCQCGRQDCACQMLSKTLMPDNLFLYSVVEHPDLVKIMPKLGGSVIWVINVDHPQKDEIIQWVSS
jgi:hypothetical protein